MEISIATGCPVFSRAANRSRMELSGGRLDSYREGVGEVIRPGLDIPKELYLGKIRTRQAYAEKQTLRKRQPPANV
jgi:hypothetical protein